MKYENLLKYENTKLYGDSVTFSLSYRGNKTLRYSEEIKLTFFCKFHFANFPFDSHECHLQYGDNLFGNNEIILNPPKLCYGNSETSAGKDPIVISDSPFPYEIELEPIPSFEKENEGFVKHSYTGISFKLRRNSLGQLQSGYYYPTASFAILSLISFLIPPDQVIKNIFEPGL